MIPYGYGVDDAHKESFTVRLLCYDNCCDLQRFTHEEVRTVNSMLIKQYALVIECLRPYSNFKLLRHRFPGFEVGSLCGFYGLIFHVFLIEVDRTECYVEKRAFLSVLRKIRSINERDAFVIKEVHEVVLKS